MCVKWLGFYIYINTLFLIVFKLLSFVFSYVDNNWLSFFVGRNLRHKITILISIRKNNKCFVTVS